MRWLKHWFSVFFAAHQHGIGHIALIIYVPRKQVNAYI